MLFACSEDPQKESKEEKNQETIEQKIRNGEKPTLKTVSDIADETFYFYMPDYADIPLKVIEEPNPYGGTATWTYYYEVTFDQTLAFNDNESGIIKSIYEYKGTHEVDFEYTLNDNLITLNYLNGHMTMILQSNKLYICIKNLSPEDAAESDMEGETITIAGESYFINYKGYYVTLK